MEWKGENAHAEIALKIKICRYLKHHITMDTFIYLQCHI